MLNEKDVLKKLEEAGMRASFTDVRKNNNVMLRGVTIGNGKVKPTLYLQFYNDVDDLVKDAIRAYQDLPEFDETIMQDWDYVKDRLRIKLSSNPETSFYYPAFCDLKMVPYIKLSEEATVTVGNPLFELWGKGKEIIFTSALANTEKYEGSKLINMIELIGQLTGDDYEDLKEEDRFMHVLTTNTGRFGASAILYFKDLPEKFYMIPSSIHETILIYPIESCPKERLTDLVKEVNSTIDPREVLADHAYEYTKGFWKII